MDPVESRFRAGLEFDKIILPYHSPSPIMNTNSWAQSLSISAAAAAQVPISDVAFHQNQNQTGSELESPWLNTNPDDFRHLMGEIQNNTEFLAQDRIQHRSMDGKFFVLLQTYQMPTFTTDLISRFAGHWQSQSQYSEGAHCL